jgi:hypothetical protein
VLDFERVMYIFDSRTDGFYNVPCADKTFLSILSSKSRYSIGQSARSSHSLWWRVAVGCDEAGIVMGVFAVLGTSLGCCCDG